jgi:uncharacterized protein YndB with AHSA1/START domain
MKKVKVLAVIVVALLGIFLSLGSFFPTVEYSCSLPVRGTPAKCWNTLHDTSKMSRWITGLESFRQIQGDSLMPGAVYEIIIRQDKRMVMQEEVKEMTKPIRIGYELNNNVLKSQYSFDFVGKDGQTQITSTYRVTGKNLMWKSLFVLSKSYFRKGSMEQLESLKKLIESLPD